MKTVLKIKTLSATLATGAILTLCLSARAQSAAVGQAVSANLPAIAQGPVVESVRTGQMISPDGETAITSVDRKWDRNTGTGTINEAAVTPDGKISIRAANLTREPDGAIIAKGTFTDFDGRSANYTETTKRTAAGTIVVGRLVDDGGNVATYETTSARAGRHQTKLTTVITYADGKKATRVEILAVARPVAGS